MSISFYKKTARFTFFLLILLISGVFLVYRVYLPRQFAIPNKINKLVEFEIKSGESVKSVAKRLEQLDVVSDDWALLQYLKSEALDTKVEAGHFRFQGGETIPEVAEILLKSQAQQISLTILEGWNSFEMDAKLAELGLIEPNDFALFVREGGSEAGNRPTDFSYSRTVASLEGYLFPATYFIDPPNFSVDDLVERMLTTMDQKLIEAGWEPTDSSKNLHQILTMASIIELEEKEEKNRPLVADILWRRFNSGMALGADATLFYVLGHKQNLTYDDLQTDNPYNTRKFTGLPPTPVCSPSLSAIKAALNPEPNEYWYYLHDSKTGEIHFAKTLEEHNENKRKFIQ